MDIAIWRVRRNRNMLTGLSAHLATMIAILTAFSAVGLAIDKLLLTHQRKRLADAALSYWLRIADTKIIDLPLASAETYLAFIRMLIGQKMSSVTGILRALAVSAIATTAVFLIGQFLAFYLAHRVGQSDISINELIQASWWAFQTHGKKHIIYPTNMFFDLVTVMETTFLISYIRNSRSYIIRIPIIIIDILIATTLFFICLYFLFEANGLYSMSGQWRTPSQFFSLLIDRAGFGETGNFDFFWTVPQLAFTSTIFYPTILFLLFLLIITTMHIFSILAKQTGLQLLELSSESERSIFFYTGTFLGIVTSVMSIFSW